jgi:hypothetical protein
MLLKFREVGAAACVNLRQTKSDWELSVAAAKAENGLLSAATLKFKLLAFK